MLLKANLKSRSSTVSTLSKIMSDQACNAPACNAPACNVVLLHAQYNKWKLIKVREASHRNANSVVAKTLKD